MNFRVAVDLWKSIIETRQPSNMRGAVPDVLVIKKRAFVRLARPSMLSVPMNEVLMVLTALNW